MFKKTMLLAMSGIGILVMSGCSAKGPKFKQFDRPDSGKSNVYVYRDSSMVGMGVTPDIHKTDLKTNQDEVIGSLKPGSYILTKIKPGMYEFWAKTEAKNEVKIKVDSNKTYCIKNWISMGVFVGHPQFKIVDMDKCKEEIKETNLTLPK